MDKRILVGTTLAAAIGVAAHTAQAGPLVGCESLTTFAEWGATRGCAIGGMIFTLGRGRGDISDFLLDFDAVDGAVLLTTRSPDADALAGTIFYTVEFDPTSAARIIEVQLFGVRQARAAIDQGGARLTAFTDPDPIAIPTVIELNIGNTRRPEAAPEAFGAIPPPPDPALFDSDLIDARTLQVTTGIIALGSAREGALGLDSVTAVYVLAGTEVTVPAPASLALAATGLALGAALRRRRR